MGSVGAQRTARTKEPFNVGGNYKATQEMIDTVRAIAEEVREDFPILDTAVDISFNKGLGRYGGLGWQDEIELNGKLIKDKLAKALHKDYAVNEIRGFVSHELTHVMQDRMNSASGIFGSDNREDNIERIWNNAVNNYLKSPESIHKTKEQVDKMMSNVYGGGGHSRIGGRVSERMAVAVENYYTKDHTLAQKVGKYVVEELKKEQAGLKYTRKRK